jgi:hypothetical protein
MTGFRSGVVGCVLGLVAVTAGTNVAESQERGRGGRSGGVANSEPQAPWQRVDALVQSLNVRSAQDGLAGPVVAGAPFSADATTTVTQILGDGTRIEQRTTTKLFRDGTGRVRREQTVIGLDRLNGSNDPQTTVTFDTVPGDPMPFLLDVTSRTARRVGRGVFWLSGDTGGVRSYTVSTGAGVARRAVRTGLEPGPATPIPNDVKPTEEQLGTRLFDGIKATGHRTTTIIPTDRIGNDKPIQITNEEWESPELRTIVYSRFSDPRTGVVEYRLTGITRNEPRADLFSVPPDYTVIETAAPGLRIGGVGRGGSGARGN